MSLRLLTRALLSTMLYGGRCQAARNTAIWMYGVKKFRRSFSTQSDEHLQTRSASDESSERQPRFSEEITSMDQDDRQFVELTVETFNELITSEEDRADIQKILDDYEYMKYVTYRVPSTISSKHMKEAMLLQHQDPESKELKTKKYFEYLFQVEMAIRRRNKAKKIKADAYLEYKATQHYSNEPGNIFDESNKLVYSTFANSIISWLPDQTYKKKVHYAKKVHAAMFGQKLVFDFDFESMMPPRDLVNMAKQVAHCYGMNYKSNIPYDLFFCNYQKKSLTDKHMSYTIGNLHTPESMITIEKRSYLDIFPKDQLVYLTPHSNVPMTEYDHDAVFIMAALVDRTIKKPMTLAKARKEGICMARLPIDNHVVWGTNAKVLTLNQIVGIMLEAKEHGDWKKALLAHIPSRKLKSLQDIEREDAIRLEKLNFRRKNFFRISEESKSSNHSPKSGEPPRNRGYHDRKDKFFKHSDVLESSNAMYKRKS